MNDHAFFSTSYRLSDVYQNPSLLGRQAYISINDFEYLTWLHRSWPLDRPLWLDFSGALLDDSHLNEMHDCFYEDSRVHAMLLNEVHTQALDKLGAFVRSLPLKHLEIAFLGVDVGWLSRYLGASLISLHLEGNMLDRGLHANEPWHPVQLQHLYLRRTECAPPLLFDFATRSDCSALRHLVIDGACAQLDVAAAFLSMCQPSSLVHLELISCMEDTSSFETEAILAPKLKALSLHEHPLSAPQLTGLINGLGSYCIQRLDLESFHFTNEHLDCFAGQTSLISLVLDESSIDFGVGALVDALPESLQQLSLSGLSHIDISAFTTLLSQLEQHQLRSLDMSRILDQPEEHVFLKHPFEVEGPYDLGHLDLCANDLGRVRGCQAILGAVLSHGRFGTVDISSNEMTMEGVSILPWQCECLDAAYNQLTCVGLTRLLENLNVQRLRELHLRSNSLNDQIGRVLWHCQRLESLDLSYNPITSGGLTALFSSGRWSTLTELDLSGLTLSSTTMVELVHGCPNLESLALDHAILDVDGMAILLRSPLMGQLKSLSLNQTHLGAGVLKWLTGLSQHIALRDLYLDGNQLSDALISLFLQSPAAQNLDHFQAIDGRQRQLNVSVKMFMDNHPMSRLLLW